MNDTNLRTTDLEKQIERLWQQIEVKDSQIAWLHAAQQKLHQYLFRLTSPTHRRDRKSGRHSSRRRDSSHLHRRPVYRKSEIAALIERDFDDFLAGDVRFAGQGANFCTYVLNNEYVIRCCRDLQSIGKLRREEKLLPKLQSKMAIPRFRHVGHMNNGLPYCIYRMIQGEPFDGERYSRLSAEPREQAAEKMGSFLTELHNYPLQEALSLAIRFNDMLEFPLPDLLGYVQRKVQPNLPETERGLFQRWMDWYAEKQDSISNEPRLVHGDLGPHHILFDEESQEISGVIDFSEVHMNDPDIDLYAIYEIYGQDFQDRFKKYYRRPTEDNPQKFAFIRLTRIAEQICHVSAHGRAGDMEDALDELRRFLNDSRAEI